jgi:hypothetical protein
MSRDHGRYLNKAGLALLPATKKTQKPTSIKMIVTLPWRGGKRRRMNGKDRMTRTM